MLKTGFGHQPLTHSPGKPLRLGQAVGTAVPTIVIRRNDHIVHTTNPPTPSPDPAPKRPPAFYQKLLVLYQRGLAILVSMVGFLTGVVRSPFTAAILVLEMTDRHAVIFQLLLGGIMAQGAASLVDSESFYEHLRLGFLREAMADPGGVAPALPAETTTGPLQHNPPPR